MSAKEWMKNVRRVEPYVPGEQPQEEGYVKLNTNENPYPPSPMVRERCLELDVGRMRLYPDANARALTRALAEYHQLEEERVFVGVGSDDVLGMSFLTFFNSGKPILFPDVTYSFYDVWADLYAIPYERPPLDDEFRVNREDYYRENGGVVLANPNAPTSVGEGVGLIRDVVERNPASVVIVDEAYVDFGGETALGLLDDYDNVLVVRTFSKSRSMAGARIGYAMGSEPLIRALSDVKNSYNSYPMSMASIALGVESVRDEAYFRETVGKVVRTREWVKRELVQMGFCVLDSQTNFLFASHEGVEAADLFEWLKERKVLVRHFKQDRIRDFLRITVGTDEEMRLFLEKIGMYLKE